MKIQSGVFVLFLVSFSTLSTHTWAQTFSIQPQTEQEASQEAHMFSQETQWSQALISEAQKAEHRSSDALHWTAVGTNQKNQFVPTVSQRPIDTPRVSPFGIDIDKPVEKPITTMKKSADDRL